MFTQMHLPIRATCISEPRSKYFSGLSLYITLSVLDLSPQFLLVKSLSGKVIVLGHTSDSIQFQDPCQLTLRGKASAPPGSDEIFLRAEHGQFPAHELR